MLAILILMFVVAAAAPKIFVTVPSGHAGVLWLRFWGGTDTSQPGLSEGLHVIFPWDQIFIYDMRMKAQETSYEVISKDGLHFQVDFTVIWRLLPNTIARLHKEYGQNYVNILLLPEVGSVARSTISQYHTEEVYTYERSNVRQRIQDEVVNSRPGNRVGSVYITSDNNSDYISLTDLMITKMTLPSRIQESVSRKMEQLLMSEEYVYRLAVERQEAERKAIEAGGIQAFQQIVQKGITDSFLKWRGIEATLKLATSPNAKVVVIGGGGSQGLPLILNTGDASVPVAAASPNSAAPEMAAPKAGLDNTAPPVAKQYGPGAPGSPTDAAALPPAMFR
jgi:regulator of protease activity HflC (stomatin/prohibitin superfamily)